MSIFTTLRSSTFRRRAAQQLALVTIAALTTACGIADVCFNGSEVALGKKAPPRDDQIPFATLPPTTATAAPKTSATAAASGTTASTPAAISGTLGIGYDHPPFMQPWGVGGNSIAFVCGQVAGGPTAIEVGLSGTTGQPGNLVVPVGPDGKFSAPFPIMQYGTLNASVTQAQTASGPRPVSGIAAKPLEVKAGADVACAP
ncbi:MAG: hypothetical protein WC211_06265 [Dehalococcoidia bacterium]